MSLNVDRYRLIEYLTEFIESIDVPMDRKVQALPCEFGFVIEFTGTPTDRDTIRVELTDAEARTLLHNEFVIRPPEIVADRAEFRLAPVTLPEEGIYMVRVWLGPDPVFSHTLTLTCPCPL